MISIFVNISDFETDSYTGQSLRGQKCESSPLSESDGFSALLSLTLTDIRAPGAQRYGTTEGHHTQSLIRTRLSF